MIESEIGLNAGSVAVKERSRMMIGNSRESFMSAISVRGLVVG